MITASIELLPDYEETAKTATDAFASANTAFCAKQIQWLYERCFGLSTTVVTLRDGDRKVGQCALIHQKVVLNGRAEITVQIVDLFLNKAYRTKECLIMLYGAVEKQCLAENVRFALGVPNRKAVNVNEHFFKMRPFLSLPIRMGCAAPLLSSALTFSGPFRGMDDDDAIRLFDRYQTSTLENGLCWKGKTLYARLCSPIHSYGVHASEDLLLISSLRMSRGVQYVLLCGLFVRLGSHSTSKQICKLVRAACFLWKLPIFVYIGFNNALPN